MANVTTPQLMEIIGAQRVENLVLAQQVQELSAALNAGCQRPCCTAPEPAPEADQE